MLKTCKYLLLNLLKSRFMLGYGFTLMLLCTGLFLLTDDADKAIIGIHHVLLILIPLVVMIYTVTQIYQSTDFIRLLLTQPIQRKAIFYSQFLANAVVLIFIQTFAIGICIAVFSNGELLPVILINIVFLTLIFSAISGLIAFSIQEKMKGIGLAIFLGIYFLAIYDGILLWLIQAMSDYPIEKYGIVLSLFNPIDLCRILFIFKMDISALMGITGAIMQKFLGSAMGSILIYLVLFLWVIIPLWLSARCFIKKDY